MKKMIAFLMVLCLMMTASFAAVAEAPAVVQDELPPELIAVDGVVARILDANGNVLAEITDAGLLKMTDVHDRDSELLPDVKQRLLDAYAELMSNVHFTDATSAAEFENLKEEINQELANNALDLSAYDVHMFELFDVKLLGENAALLTDGAVLEFVIKPLKLEVAPLLVSFSADGKEWHLLKECTTNPDGTMTLRLPSAGTVAIILEFVATNFPGNYYVDYTTLQTTDKETYPNFTPSVTGKPAPSVVVTVDGEGRVVVANIYFNEGKSIRPIYTNDALVITPVSMSPYVMDVTTHEHLQWSYDGILQAENIGNIRTGIGMEIDEMLKADGFGHLTHFDMVVRDLFEVTLYGDAVELFYTDDAYLEIKLDALLAEDEPLVVIFSNDSYNWHVLPRENMELSENGTLTLKLKEMGTVAFLVERADTLTNVSVKSPE